MNSPIFDSIVAARDATPVFESISGSFPAVRLPHGPTPAVTATTSPLGRTS